MIMALEAQMNSENQGSRMFGSQELIVINNNNNGYGGFGDGFNQFSFNNVQPKPQHVLQYQPPPMIPGTLAPAPHNKDYMVYTIAAQEAKQRQELDDYLRQQDEMLRRMLQEQRKQQLALLLKRVESNTQAIMKQKDEEISQAMKKRMELQGLIRTMEAETLQWQILAQQNEAMGMSLKNSIQHYKERVFNNGAMEDAESCCHSNKEDEGDEEEVMRIVCKGCKSERACVLFLPCRHLCACKACEVGLDACPVCLTPKKARIEALISYTDFPGKRRRNKAKE